MCCREKSMNFFIINSLFHIIVPSILLIVGNIGNFLIILIFVRKSLIKYSSSVYFISIAIADTFALNIECLQFYVPTLINYLHDKSYFNEFWGESFKKDLHVQIRSFDESSSYTKNDSIFNNKIVSIISAVHLNDVICKLESLSFYTAYECSSWLLVLLSFDRCMTITFPLNRICKPRVAVLFVFICVTVVILINCHGLFFVQLIENESVNHTMIQNYLKNFKKFENMGKNNRIKLYEYKCGVDKEKYPFYSKFYNNHWNTFDFGFSVLTPAILLTIFNAKIIYTMRKSLVKLKCNYETLRYYSNNVLSKKIGNIYYKKILKLKQTNIMLISAVLTFFLSYAPYSIYYMIVYNTDINEDKDIVGQVLLLWSLLNVSFDFYIFYFTGSSIFRIEFKKIKLEFRKSIFKILRYK